MNNLVLGYAPESEADLGETLAVNKAKQADSREVDEQEQSERYSQSFSHIASKCLHIIQFAIVSVFGDKFVVGSSFDYLAFVHHDNFVRALDG